MSLASVNVLIFSLFFSLQLEASKVTNIKVNSNTEIMWQYLGSYLMAQESFILMYLGYFQIEHIFFYCYGESRKCSHSSLIK